MSRTPLWWTATVLVLTWTPVLLLLRFLRPAPVDPPKKRRHDE